MRVILKQIVRTFSKSVIDAMHFDADAGELKEMQSLEDRNRRMRKACCLCGSSSGQESLLENLQRPSSVRLQLEILV